MNGKRLEQAEKFPKLLMHYQTRFSTGEENMDWTSGVEYSIPLKHAWLISQALYWLEPKNKAEAGCQV